MDQDYRRKSGREDLEDKVQDQIRAKEEEIRGLREEIRALREEIKAKEEEIIGVEKEIVIASETEVRRLEAKVQFLRQEISIRDQQISSRDQQIVILLQEICSVRSIQEAPASAGVLSGVSEKLLQDLTEFLIEQNAKSKSKKSIQLSSVSQSDWDTLERQLGLKMIFKELESNPEHLSDLPAFGWDDRQERSQADRYIPHLNKIATMGEWMMIDAANNHPTLLSGFLGGWNVKGTTDAACVHRKYSGLVTHAVG